MINSKSECRDETYTSPKSIKNRFWNLASKHGKLTYSSSSEFLLILGVTIALPEKILIIIPIPTIYLWHQSKILFRSWNWRWCKRFCQKRRFSIYSLGLPSLILTKALFSWISSSADFTVVQSLRRMISVGLL